VDLPARSQVGLRVHEQVVRAKLDEERLANLDHREGSAQAPSLNHLQPKPWTMDRIEACKIF
jgi:hypothetical protein